MEETNSHHKVLDTVLLIDDDDTTNYINKRVLAKAGVANQIDVVNNGDEALNFLRTQAPPETGKKFMAPDLMFLDIKMSVMDGFEFLDEYRNLNPEMKARVVIMLSSSASFYDLQRLQQYPEVAQHISKPLTKAHVEEIMKTYFSASQEAQA